MTIFASTPPINDDGYPYTNANGDRFWHDPDNPDGTVLWGSGENAGHWVEFSGDDQLDPRPEFVRPRAHGANSVLLYVRRDAEGDELVDPDIHGAVRVMVTYLTLHRGHAQRTYTSAECDHARAVLSRWIGIFG